MRPPRAHPFQELPNNSRDLCIPHFPCSIAPRIPSNLLLIVCVGLMTHDNNRIPHLKEWCPISIQNLSRETPCVWQETVSPFAQIPVPENQRWFQRMTLTIGTRDEGRSIGQIVEWRHRGTGHGHRGIFQKCPNHPLQVVGRVVIIIVPECQERGT